jgi:hypothetical protein
LADSAAAGVDSFGVAMLRDPLTIGAGA